MPKYKRYSRMESSDTWNLTVISRLNQRLKVLGRGPFILSKYDCSITYSPLEHASHMKANIKGKSNDFYSEMWTYDFQSYSGTLMPHG